MGCLHRGSMDFKMSNLSGNYDFSIAILNNLLLGKLYHIYYIIYK